jgi:hypothetical protein
MARIIYCHPRQSKYDYHIYTDLDFWDTRRLLKGLATVKRNFGKWPPGDGFPTQVVGMEIQRGVMKEIERRLAKALVSPPRHVIVQAMVMQGYFEFDPKDYYPTRWSASRMMHFTYRRLPLEQGALSNAYQTVRLCWANGNIRVERVQREKKYDPVIKNSKDARRYAIVPSCF